jgi:hypothetical protein
MVIEIINTNWEYEDIFRYVVRSFDNLAYFKTRKIIKIFKI